MLLPRPIKLYDRLEEQNRLEEAYVNRTFCLISGAPGSGKTALALSLRDRVQKDGGYFINGKFDQFQSRSPYPAFVSAFTEFAHQVEARGQLEAMRERIQSNIQAGGRVLTDMIPALKSLVGDQEPHRALQGEKAILRFVFVFRTFLHSLASPGQPIVICIDDLQWADPCSVQLLSSLIPSTRDGGIVFVATCREDVSYDSILSRALRDLERDKVDICHISVRNFSSNAMTEIVEDMLSPKPEDVGPLVEFLKTHTKGNVYFLLELLRHLQQEGFLKTGPPDQWNIHILDWRDTKWSLRHLLREKMKQLPQSVQEVLKVAAFLQGSSNLSIDLITRCTSAPVHSALKGAAERHLIVHDNDSYWWVHDEVEAAAYSLVNPDQVHEMHLKIGRKLWRSMQVDELKHNIFAVLNQLMRAANLIVDQQERYAVASLCLWAGETAARASTFRTARVYLDMGLDLLHKNQWHDHYDLSITLYSLAAECAYCLGEFGQAKSLCQQVFKHGRNLQDMIRLHVLHICCLGSTEKMVEAKEHSFIVLRQLGETFPRKATKLHVALAALKTRRMLRVKSNDTILKLANMSDPVKLAVMQILNVMFLNVYVTDPLIAPLIAIRMVNLSIRYGLSSLSSLGFAAYGVLSCSLDGRVDLGYKYGQLALHLLEKFNCPEFLPRVHAAVYGFIYGWKHEFSLSLEPLRYAHQIGLETGDTEFAVVNAAIFGTAFNSGLPLSYCDNQICSFIRTLESRNQDSSLLNIRPLLQLIRNLMGKNTLSTTKLTGDIVNEESLVRIITVSGDQNMLNWVHYQIALLNFIFGDFDRAATEIKMARPLTLTPFSSVEVGFVVMLDGLIHLAPGKHESISRARKCISILRRVSRRAPNHLLRCLYLLQAELAACTGDEERAIVKFMSATAMAVENHAIMDLGIALERFGALYTRLGQSENSLRYYRRALDTFQNWEAIAKVQQLLVLYPALR